ncbi:Crp/Fnr family transcriptional regulator [Hespellia stercorisuis]|uniref:cAMP-binding domain of CRP or a regulatory subunit of cAMP-dependent protein kinases n=1 Tax=Hespellia stercorisuis DSM 15480 TaxID=1121950 RepID=A0A1M6LY18_9FIRM|nr:Crp/Fnr family transcriptional regulator [Hespellia stercorisuis]SHJ76108.1 cAMP-binding domain of CRP or a regulatory subunit of cAMP-dependent protein kinases [Hespellia stercorisuis DSM 15480]
MIQTNIMDVLEALERDKKIYDIFKNCPYEILRTIQLKRYKAGKFVLEQGVVHDTFYIIVEGCADIYVESEHGKKYYLNTYEKGQYIGELEIFDRVPYMSRIESKGEVVVLEVGRENCLKWIRSDQNFSEYILHTLCRGTYRTYQNMGDNSLYTLKQRICQFLIDNTDDEGHFHVPLHTETLSERMAVTPRSVNRILKQLRDDDVIEINKTMVTIKNYDQLLEER